MNEKIIKNGDIEICTESFGKTENPPVILIMGAAVSMIWWDSEFCRKLAGNNLFVIRFDNRDTGKSTCYPPGEPHYSVIDMADDILAVMNAYNFTAANLVGMSLGGMLAQIVATQHSEKVNSLTLISSSVWDDNPNLPPVDGKVIEYHSSAATLNWDKKNEVINYMVGGWRILNGSKYPFDKMKTAVLAEVEFYRAKSLQSMFNLALLKGGEEFYGKSSTISKPALIIHGTEDIVLPYEHAIELKKTIKGSKLLTLEGRGHEIHTKDRDLIINAIKRLISD